MFLGDVMVFLQHERYMSTTIERENEHVAPGDSSALHTVIDLRQDPTTDQSANSLQMDMHKADLGFRK